MKKINIKKSISVMIPVFIVLFVFNSGIVMSGEKAGEKKMCNNPFFKKYDTPFEVPPFDLIKEDHYIPAFKKGMKDHMSEINAIINSKEEPNFVNTIEALENSGELLSNVSAVFFSLYSSLNDEKMQDIAKQMSPLLSKHEDDISLNEELFRKIKIVYDNREKLNLNPEQKKVLEEYYKGFVRSGANLNEEDKSKLRKVNQELSALGLRFGKNLLAETNSFKMVIDKKEDLVGLPESVISGAAETAEAMGEKGKWVFTPQRPSWTPFLQYSPRRDLREKLYKGYILRGDNNNENDNKKIIAKIASLRVRKARIMGYETYADFKIERNMAKTPANVYKLLDQIWVPALKMAKDEAAELQRLIDEEGGDFKLASWDWWYYTEKLRKEKYDFDEGSLRPYFKLENVRNGAFYVANKLYGIKFVERKDIPIYHKDVMAFEVLGSDEHHIGILYMDFFPRKSKRGGAWCGSLRDYHFKNGKEVTPVVYMVLNASKPVGDQPALLSPDDASTLFHEFGHALHNLFSTVKYKSISGTNVALDFVELPSQIMENWALHPDVLKFYAKNYKTGELIPKELLDKLNASKHFNQGFMTLEYLAACYLDLNWYSLKDEKLRDANKFEKEFLKKRGMIPEIVPRYRSTYFAHIINGYDAGYYVYIWAEVLDSDAFEAFKENGIFDKKTAKAFRDNILARGGSEDPMVLYKKFRGAEPKIDSLLRKKGMSK